MRRCGNRGVSFTCFLPTHVATSQATSQDTEYFAGDGRRVSVGEAAMDWAANIHRAARDAAGRMHSMQVYNAGGG